MKIKDRAAVRVFCFLFIGLVIIGLTLSGCESVLESYGKAEGVFSVIHVKTDTVSEADVVGAYLRFARSENLQCAPISNAPRPTLSCHRNGLHLDAIRYPNRVKFTSLLEPGYFYYSAPPDENREKAMEKALKGAKAPFRVFNTRFSEYLRSNFANAVE